MRVGLYMRVPILQSFCFTIYVFSCRLVKVTLYGSQIKLYNIETAVPSVLKPDLIDV